MVFQNPTVSKEMTGGKLPEKQMVVLLSRELTYPIKKWHFEDDFPFPQVGYVNSLEGICITTYLEPFDDPCFDRKGPSFGGLTMEKSRSFGF